jgi:hypothetical protein
MNNSAQCQSSASKKPVKEGISYNYQSNHILERPPTLKNTLEGGQNQSYLKGKKFSYQTYKQRITYAKGKAKDEKSDNLTRLDTGNEIARKLDVSNWNFVRGEQQSGTINLHQRNFFQFLNECRGETKLKSFFVIESDQIKEFFKGFQSAKICKQKF